MDTYIENDFTATCHIYFEQSIAINGFTYLLIFGEHINGGFICIPNWNISCEASNLGYSSSYNASKMISAGLDETVARILAKYIEEYLKEMETNE